MLMILVAPLVGAWIEMTLAYLITQFIPSLPSWERGLKFIPYAEISASQ